MITRDALKLWYIVFLSALIGSFYSAAFPQFSMTVAELSAQSGISVDLLLGSDSFKSIFIVIGMWLSGLFYRRLGLKITFVAATICFIIPQLFIPSVKSVLSIYLLKSVQGFSSLSYSVFLTLIMKYAPARKTGLATALFNGVFFGGSGVISLLTGYIIIKRDWIDSYLILTIILLILSILWVVTIKDKEEVEPKLSFCIDNKKVSGITLICSTTAWLLMATLFSTVWTNQALLVDMPLYLGSLGFSTFETGKIISITTPGILLSCFLSGLISDAVTFKARNKSMDRIKVLMVGPGIMILSLAGLMIFNNAGRLIFILIIFFLAFGSAWGFGSFYSILPGFYNDENLPIATGIIGGTADIAMPLSPLVVGVVFGLKGAWGIGWSVCIIMAVISLFSGIFLLKNIRVKALSHL